MTVKCGFCQRRGHNIVSCKRLAAVMARIEKNIDEQVMSEYKLDVIMQTRTLVEKLQADMTFLLAENQRLAEEHVRIWQWLGVE